MLSIVVIVRIFQEMRYAKEDYPSYGVQKAGVSLEIQARDIECLHEIVRSIELGNSETAIEKLSAEMGKYLFEDKSTEAV